MSELHHGPDGQRGQGGSDRRARLGRAPVGLVCAVALMAASVLGCPNAGEDRVLGVGGTALVGGVVYFDLDGDRQPGGPDIGLSNVRVRLVVAGTRDTAASASTDANGGFLFRSVPVGRYVVVVPGEPVFGDSIAVVRIDTSDVRAAPGDTVEVQVAVSFPRVSIEEARGLPLGTKVFVEGVALNTRGVFGDTTVHVIGVSAAIRVTRALGPVAAVGDSVRVLGRVAARDGQPVSDLGQVTILALGAARSPERVSTVAASTADGGRLDAALVRVADATISDTATVGGDYVATVDDGTGAVAVVFDQDVVFSPLPRTRFVPGATVDATGLLVPTGSGTWRVKPRSSPDLPVR